ncbi:YgjV family protein [Litchfieldia alkalitelluris]|uniref:YgjV family protein n=1 Tax=Litchfieldia alkalitelluris TaxID=304268 RepID=UPI000B446156|nr:YgjV family protein [Litchfieldia alkalitelluris]
MTINWLEWLGYLASLIVLISLLMSSIIKLRWINLIGSSIFSLYGFLIGALPVGFMNLGIAIINVYYLYKIYQYKEYFKLLPIDAGSQYFTHFLTFYKEELEKYGNKTSFDMKDYEVSFYILRNMVPAGVFIASKHNENTLEIELDFAIPEYRDFKIGNYIYDHSKHFFTEKGYNTLVSYTTNEKQMNYLKKIGFSEQKDGRGNLYFKKELN